jgi:hypothetical protein
MTLKLPPLPPMPEFVAKDNMESKEGNEEGVGASKGKTNATRKPRMRPTKNKTA